MALRTRNVLALCAGVGGLDLGIALALHCRGEAARGVCYVEREAAAAASLVASMDAGWLHPAPVWSDLLTFDARPWRGRVHIVASGDPCQDNSVAGKGAGADGERFLAPEVVRIARECWPDAIFRENVPGNADGQLAAIVPPLEGMGYRVAAGIFSSAETGNTMRRERLFVMARAGGAAVERLGRELPGAEGAQAGRGDHRPRRDGPAVGSAVGSGDGWLAPVEGRGTLGRASTDRASDRGSQSVERSESLGRREGRAEPAGQQGRRAAARPGGELERAIGGRRRREGHSGVPSGQLARPGRPLPPAVIPGPTDSRWIDVLDRWPELQPALSQEEAESHLRRGIDAMAHRIERLRATGNGVDPVVAAYAFLRLSALLDETSGPGVALMRIAA